MKKMKRAIALFLVAAVLIAVCTGCDDGRSGGDDRLSSEKAVETLDALLTKVDVTEITAQMDLEGVESSDLASELPDISTYEPSVQGGAVLNVEIMASTEKGVRAQSGKNIDGWLVDAAEKFNQQGFDVNGTGVSVTIRPVASGTASEYIISGKHVPAGFAPSNVLWAKMIEAEGVSLELIAEKTAGNTAGILMSQKRYADFTEKHGEVTLETVAGAVLDGDLLLGYTNPYTSSTGLNMLIHILATFDSGDPLGSAATDKFEKMQKNIPPVSFTTAQMRETAEKGLIDAMVMEYQAYINNDQLKNHEFVPFGVRHDNPVYATENCSAEEKEVLKLFTDYLLTDEIQKMAEDVGFNANNDYQEQSFSMTGEDLLKAQGIWKEKKDAGQPVVAVFVTDISGSMDGTPITELKTSLLNASQYIGEDNYIGLVSYSNKVYLNLPIDQFSPTQRATFNGAVKQLSANGGTATYDAVLVAAKMLLDKKEEIPNAKLMMFLLSDGQQLDGYKYEKVAPVIGGLHIPVHTICYGEDISEMKELSLLNEASNIQAKPEDVVYNLKNMFNAQM